MRGKVIGVVCLLPLVCKMAYGQATMPEGWQGLGAAEFAGAVDTLLTANPGPAPTTLEAVANHYWTAFLDKADFVNSTEISLLMRMVAQATNPSLAPWYTAERKAAFIPLLESRLQAADLFTQGSFDENSQSWDTSARAGVNRTLISTKAAVWMDKQDWRALTLDRKVKLLRLLEDEKGDRKRYSLRWTGFLKPQRNDSFTFELNMRVGNAKVWLNENLIIDSDTPEIAKTSSVQELMAQNNPIKIEFSYDYDTARDPAPDWAGDLFYCWTHLLLSWKSGISVDVIPEEVLIQENGNGLKLEVFNDPEFSELISTQVVPEVAWVRYGIPLLSTQAGKQREVAAELAKKLGEPAQLNDNDDPQFIRYFSSAGECFRINEQVSLLAALASHPQLMRNTPPSAFWHFLKGIDYIPSQLRADVIIAWASIAPVLNAEFGAYPGWQLEIPTYSWGNYGGYWHVARHVSESQKDKLIQAMNLPDGSCNDRLSRILSCFAKETGTIEEWCGYLDARLTDQTLTAETKAAWLVARAFAEELRKDGEPEVLAGSKWLQEAISLSPTEKKLRIVRELAARLAACGKAAEVQNLISGVSEQLNSEEAQAAFSDWIARAEEIKAHFSAEQQKQKEESKAAYRSVIESRLQIATQNNDTRSIQRYRQILSELKK